MSAVKKKTVKAKKAYGVYEVDRTEAECRRAQWIRTLLLVLQNALLAGMIFIPTDSFTYMFGVTWLCTLYILGILSLFVTAVYASVLASRGAKFAPQISEKYVPRRGLNSLLTFGAFELDFLLRAAWTALQIYITVRVFDAAGSVLSCMAAASMLLSFATRTYTARFYNGRSRFIPAKPNGADNGAPDVTLSDEAEDFYAVSHATAETKSGNAKSNVTPTSEEAEDFYAVSHATAETKSGDAKSNVTPASEEAEDFYAVSHATAETKSGNAKSNVTPTSEEAEDFYAISHATAETKSGNAKSNVTPASEEAEDFYGDGQ